MKFAYKVFHSEAHKSVAKLQGGRSLDANEISLKHQALAASLQEFVESDPAFDVTMQLLHPSVKGVIIVLEAEGGSDAADAWIVRYLVRLNKLDQDLCLIAEPLPAG